MSSVSVEAQNQSTFVGPVEETIREKLLKAFYPVAHLSILNESNRHNVPVNSETHFKVVIVSPVFDNVPSLIQRHRLVNQVLSGELKGPIHALSIVAKTPGQWSQNSSIEPSPACRGGDGSLPPKSSGS